MPKNLEISSTTSNQLLELAKTMRSLGGNMALAGEAIERLTAESELHLQELRSYRITVENREARIAQLEAQLIAEAARTAEQKLRADQLEKQHAMQAKMHAEAARKVAELEKDAARYRWLCSGGITIPEIKRLHIAACFGDKLDEVIDAAMRSKMHE